MEFLFLLQSSGKDNDVVIADLGLIYVKHNHMVSPCDLCGASHALSILRIFSYITVLPTRADKHRFHIRINFFMLLVISWCC